MLNEIEVKSLVKTKAEFDSTVERLGGATATNSQLNHYFDSNPRSIQVLFGAVDALTNYAHSESIRKMLSHEKQSIRTRREWGDGMDEATLIAKWSLNKESSANSDQRGELTLDLDRDLDSLDSMLIDAGMTYLSKWSRTRHLLPFQEQGNFCIVLSADWNSGYGGVIEAEIALPDGTDPGVVERATETLQNWLSNNGLKQFKPEEVDKLFDIYNANWQRFYRQDLTIWETELSPSPGSLTV